MKRILIADDHSAIRNGVKLILSEGFGEAECGEASNAAEIFQRMKEKSWDLLILDVDMPGRNGFEVLKQLKEEKNPVHVLIFSMHPEDQLALRALRAGASGYLSKDVADTELIKAINQILQGRKYITPQVAEQLVSQFGNPADKPLHELLSDREYQTMLLIASGKTVSQIAQDLSLSVPTVSTYRARILEKMGMRTNAELASYAIRNHLV